MHLWSHLCSSIYQKWFIFCIFCWWWQNFSHDLSKIFKCTWKILLWSFKNSYGPLPSLHKEGVRVGRFVFFKIDGNGGEGGAGEGLKIFARKVGIRQNGGSCLEMGGCHVYWDFSGNSLWCSIGNLGVFIFPFLTNVVCHKIIA